MKRGHFEWDAEKDEENQAKHNVYFLLAQHAFLDPKRIIVEDINHSSEENRFYCLGRVGKETVTVRFTYRGNIVRIFGAGYWRKGRRIYEGKNKIH